MPSKTLPLTTLPDTNLTCPTHPSVESIDMSNDKLLGYLEAKLEELHSDVREVKQDVAGLKEDFIQRKAWFKITSYVTSAIAATGGYIVSHLLATRW